MISDLLHQSENLRSIRWILAIWAFSNTTKKIKFIPLDISSRTYSRQLSYSPAQLPKRNIIRSNISACLRSAVGSPLGTTPIQRRKWTISNVSCNSFGGSELRQSKTPSLTFWGRYFACGNWESVTSKPYSCVESGRFLARSSNQILYDRFQARIRISSVNVKAVRMAIPCAGSKICNPAIRPSQRNWWMCKIA
jgi:hypothetical protein